MADINENKRKLSDTSQDSAIDRGVDTISTRAGSTENDSHLALVAPSTKLQESFLEMIREWEQTGEKLEPFVLRMDVSDFSAYLYTLQQMKTASVGNRKTVNVSTYWIVSGAHGRKVIGAVTIRHNLNEHLRMIGGHIGVGIRPSERGKGYGTRALALALRKAEHLGLHKVLLTCDQDHIAARKMIEGVGGIWENEVFFNGKMVQRYWVTTP